MKSQTILWSWEIPLQPPGVVLGPYTSAFLGAAMRWEHRQPQKRCSEPEPQNELLQQTLPM